MYSFQQFLTIQRIDESTLTPAEIFVGRFQPFHKGHSFIISKMKNPVVLIVKGAKSSEDKTKNPLSFEQQRDLIHSVHPNVPVFETPSAFLPAVVAFLKEKGYTATKAFAGADRITGYKDQIKRANAKAGQMTADGKLIEPIDMAFEETPRITSATTVRDAIRNSDFKTYQDLMPKQLATKKTFDALRAHIA